MVLNTDTWGLATHVDGCNIGCLRFDYAVDFGLESDVAFNTLRGWLGGGVVARIRAATSFKGKKLLRTATLVKGATPAFKSDVESTVKTRCAACSLARSCPGRCKYSQFQHLTECARQRISPITSKTHDFKTTPATRHIAGSWSVPTAHRCPQGKVVGSPTAPQLDNKTQTLT